METEFCLTSSEIMTLQLKVTLSFYLIFIFLRVLGNVSFTDSVALNSPSWVDVIFLLHLTSSAGCVSPTIYITHYQPSIFSVIPGNPLILTTPRSMTWNKTSLWSKPTLLLLRQLPCRWCRISSNAHLLFAADSAQKCMIQR